MKAVINATFVLAILIWVSAGSYAAALYSPCCPTISPPCIACPSCASGGYDRSPVPVQIGGLCGAGPACGCVDPWVGCGAFCTAGQLAAGWPYGWRDQYWLRPDSNF